LFTMHMGELTVSHWGGLSSPGGRHRLPWAAKCKVLLCKKTSHYSNRTVVFVLVCFWRHLC